MLFMRKLTTKRITRLFICIILSATILTSCAPATIIPEPQTQAKSFYEYFDTVSVLISYKGDTADEFKNNCTDTESLLTEYHRLFDIYYEYAGVNNIKTINKNAGKEPVKVERKLIDFLLYCKEVYALTNGETNVAMGAVLKLWHDAREDAVDDPENAAIPSAEALENAALHTNINDVIIDEAECTVYIADPQLSLDVGSIGKGYAAEKIAEMLISRGVTSYVLNLGGNIRAIGSKVNGDGWVTGITNPDKTSTESFVCRVNIKNISLVTSGDYERYYVVDGEKYHHIIDRDTNLPAKYFSSVSVFTEDSGLADALSTTLFCMSYEDGKTLIEKIGGIDVIWVQPDGTVKMTSGITLVTD